uniref:Uncharacterized protein n=1 Tax=Cacopsylla melanoneura TaxID=428564 RepID=A0A8D8ZB38_9HEMI
MHNDLYLIVPTDQILLEKPLLRRLRQHRGSIYFDSNKIRPGDKMESPHKTCINYPTSINLLRRYYEIEFSLNVIFSFIASSFSKHLNEMKPLDPSKSIG